MNKIYEFQDMFVKTCEYKNGIGECKKKRTSKKCIDGVCEKIELPENKIDILNDYYKQIQSGEGKATPTMKKVVHSLKKKYRCPICNSYKYTESKVEHMSNRHNMFQCPICGEFHELYDLAEHIIIKHNQQTGGINPQPTDKRLYSYVKSLANKKFKSKSGIYRSSWIVREYKKRGGKYSGKKSNKSGLKRWYKEKWIDLNRPIRNSKGKIIGYKSCGRSKVKGSKEKYPLCRPSKRVSNYTPRTYSSISSKSIRKAKKEKSRIKHKGSIKFGSGDCGQCGGSQEGGYYGDPELKKQLIKHHWEKYKKCSNCSQKTLLPSKKRKSSYDLYKPSKKSQSGSGRTRSQYYGRKSKIMVKVPSNVQKVALYSFKLKKMGFGGGLETGWKRAKQLATKKEIPIEDLKYMRAWFARHLYASYPTYKQWKKAGRPKDAKWHRKHGIISWLIWAGDAGFNWVNSQKNINLLNKHYKKSYNPLRLR